MPSQTQVRTGGAERAGDHGVGRFPLHLSEDLEYVFL